MKKQIRMMMVVAVSMLGVATMVTTGCKSNSGPQEKRTAGTYVDDSAITAKIKSKMIGDQTVKAHEINVDTFQGNVQLNGFVDNDNQRSRAEQIARDTKGVVSVQNNLQLRPEAAGAGRSYNTQGQLNNSNSGAKIQGQAGGAEVKGQINTNP
jgi:hyperosmotically inducible periplasmic protein